LGVNIYVHLSTKYVIFHTIITANLYCIQFTLSMIINNKWPKPDITMNRSQCRSRPLFLLICSRAGKI